MPKIQRLKPVWIELDAHAQYLSWLRDVVPAYLRSMGFVPAPRLCMRVSLAVIEAFTNIIRHVPIKTVRISLVIVGKRLQIQVCDRGRGFPKAGPSLPKASSTHGRGLFLIQNTMDTVESSRKGGWHYLTMSIALPRITTNTAQADAASLQSLLVDAKTITMLHRLSQAIARADSMASVCREILRAVVSVIPVGKASIMKYDPSDSTLRVVAAHGMSANVAKSVRVPVGEGYSGKVFASAQPLLVEDMGAKSHARYKSRSLMVAPVTVPLRMHGTPVGVINVTDKKGGASFTKSDLELLTTISNQAASYLHLTDLAEKTQRSEQLQNEVELARAIQQRLLPDVLPKIPHLDVAGMCIPATHVGGDYFDVIQHGFAPPTLVIADVSGHSVGAALLMSAFRSTVRTGLPGFYVGPSHLMARLHAHLYPDLVRAEQWISCCYMQFLPAERAVRFTSAGHTPPLIYRLRERRFVEITDWDGILGVDPKSVFHEQRIDLDAGDWIVMFTDGLYEAHSGKSPQKMLGIERVKKIVRANIHKTPRQMVQSLITEVKKFVAPGPLKDDVTVLIARVK